MVLVRTVGMFELTFLTAGPDSQTLVVALYYSMSAAGIRAQQSVDAMAVMYTAMMLVLLVVALAVTIMRRMRRPPVETPAGRLSA